MFGFYSQVLYSKNKIVLFGLELLVIESCISCYERKAVSKNSSWFWYPQVFEIVFRDS